MRQPCPQRGREGHQIRRHLVQVVRSASVTSKASARAQVAASANRSRRAFNAALRAVPLYKDQFAAESTVVPIAEHRRAASENT